MGPEFSKVGRRTEGVICTSRNLEASSSKPRKQNLAEVDQSPPIDSHGEQILFACKEDTLQSVADQESVL